MSDPFLQALDTQVGVGARLSTAELEQMARNIPGARITSGIRDAVHNAEVGGVANSQHLAGTALDFVAPGVSLADIQAKFPGEQVLQHDAGSGMHFHVQGAPGTQAAPVAPPTPPLAANDPFLGALDSATQGADANPGQAVADNASSAPVADPNGSGDQNGSGSFGATVKSVGSGLAASNPITDSIFNGRNYFQSWKDNTAGIYSGASKVPQTALDLAAYLTRPLDGKAADSLQKSADWFDKDHAPFQRDPNSAAYGWGNLEGEIGATAPVAEIAPLTAAARAAKVGKFLAGAARYGDMAAQGGAAGAALSQGRDVGTKAAEGALLAPALGAAGDTLLPAGLKVAGAVSDRTKAIADRLKGPIADEAPAVEQTIAKASDYLPPIDAPAGVPQWNEEGAPLVGMVSDDASGGKPAPQYGVPGQPGSKAAAPAPPQVSPAKIAEALGTRGARTGIEATTDLPPEVEAHTARLIDQGVSPDQALREADITGAGAKPTIAAVTRAPEDQAAMWEGAKQATPEGRALSAQIAQNNAALHNQVQDIVATNGGVPSQGEAAQTAALSLAKASDAAKANVTGLYKTARDAEGDQTVSVDALRELLAKPEYRAPTDAASRELIGGMNTLVKEMGAQNGNRFTPDQIESLRQAANGAYDRMGGSVNGKVGEIKSALDDSLDQLEKAGPAFKAARSAHKDWAAAYENPEGISKLIRRDAQGNFINADNWRAAEGFVGSTGDKQFVQIVKQLKANGDDAAIQRLKASVVQRAYERATNNATDRLGNSTISGKLFFDQLNKIGTAKLNALFDKAEIAKLASIGRAARAMNEAVPGSVNTSNTSSALAKVLANMGEKPKSKLRLAARVAGHGVGVFTGHLGGNVAVEGINHAAGAATEHVTARKLANALKQSMDPAMARAATKAEAQRLADAIRRRGASRKVTDRSAPVAGALEERRR